MDCSEDIKQGRRGSMRTCHWVQRDLFSPGSTGVARSVREDSLSPRDLVHARRRVVRDLCHISVSLLDRDRLAPARSVTVKCDMDLRNVELNQS